MTRTRSAKPYLKSGWPATNNLKRKKKINVNRIQQQKIKRKFKNK